MAFTIRPRMDWQLRTRALALGERTLVAGIVNVTPDSFSGDGIREREEAVARGLGMLADGAALLDVGAESTRPGSGAGGPNAVSESEEQDRLLPVVADLVKAGAVVSVDTYKAATARAALAGGAEIINDVSGFLWDTAMAGVCAEARCGVVLMHTRGRPDKWRGLPSLAPETVVPLVLDGLRERLGAALAAGVSAKQIVLDPGYGFGKAFEANYPLLAGQARLLALGRPLLVGLSRKSFLGRTLGRLQGGPDAPPAQREHATLAACTAAVLNGASLLRVHTVKPAVEAAAIADAVLKEQGEELGS